PPQEAHVVAETAPARLAGGQLLAQVGERVDLKPPVNPRVAVVGAGKSPDLPRPVPVRGPLAGGSSAHDGDFAQPPPPHHGRPVRLERQPVVGYSFVQHGRPFGYDRFHRVSSSSDGQRLMAVANAVTRLSLPAAGGGPR